MNSVHSTPGGEIQRPAVPISAPIYSNQITKKKRKIGNIFSKRFFIIAGIILVVTGLGGVSYKFYSDNKKLKSNSQQSSQAENDKLVKQVGQIIELPSNEAPTVATVVDASKLKDQVFFSKAQNGDKVLLYAQAKKAILYRPLNRKIIEVAPINLGNNVAGATTATPSITPSAPSPTPTPVKR